VINLGVPVIFNRNNNTTQKKLLKVISLIVIYRKKVKPDYISLVIRIIAGKHTFYAFSYCNGNQKHEEFSKFNIETK
jgi:hypothetical protein